MRGAGRHLLKVLLPLLPLLLAATVAAALLPRPALAAALDWRDCRLEHPQKTDSVEAQCATLEVPLERPEAGTAKQAGTAPDRLALRLARIAALDRHSRAAPLFLLAGGPGQGAVSMYVAYAAAFARIHRERDIILLDLRGTGASAPQDCDFPEDWSEAASTPAAITEAARRCLDKLGPQVRWFTTAAAVQDLEDARRALGAPLIDLYAASYGTRVAQQYLRQFPARVQAAILDGVIDPQLPVGPDTPLDGERALTLIIARCGAAPECVRAYPDLPEEWQRLKARFGQDRVTLDLPDPTDAHPTTLPFNRNVLSAALRLLSYSATQASLLPNLIHRAAAGDLRPMAAQAVMTARQVGDQIAMGMQNSVVCTEDWPALASLRIDRERLAATYMGADQLDAMAAICALWPQGPLAPDLHAPLHSGVPVLLLSGEADPVTPPSMAVAAAKGLSHHRHLVLLGEGHGQLATGCMPRLLAQFLARPDPKALDVTCLAQHQPAPFFVSVSGPAP